VILWNQASVSNGFRDIKWWMWRNCWHDLKRPLLQYTTSYIGCQ